MSKTNLVVDPGVCGFTCRIEGWKKEKRVAGVNILDSNCEMINKMSTSIDEIAIKDLFLPIPRNPIFLSASRAGCHPACPVPVAVVKAMEVVLGLAVSKDVRIEFDPVGKKE